VGVDAKSLYDLKLEIIQRDLYGVDIDDFAVNIAMLRLWLSMAIDYDRDAPQPLPNLDFNVLCGDSLLGPHPSAGVEVQGTLGQDIEQFRKLGELKGKYMRASDGNEKVSLREEIRETEDAIRDDLGAGGADEGAIDWRVEFAEVFAERQGFDVAIANPPYVRQEEIVPANYRAIIAGQYKEAVDSKSDLFCYFYVRALQLLVKGGIHTFVCSNAWLDSQYGEKLQDFLVGKAGILAVYESAIERQFSTAKVNTIISILRNGTEIATEETKFVSLLEAFEVAISKAEFRKEIRVSKDELTEF
jgi:hypothetical protein